MPRFDDMPKETRDDVRQYLRSLADAARRRVAGQSAAGAGGG
jgi:hypothetical protein